MGFKGTRLEIAAAAVLFGVLIYQLLLPPIVGLASNGDYARITAPMGLAYAVVPEHENEYLVRRYIRITPYNWSGYHSSEMLLVKLALEADRELSKDDGFDLTVLGFVHSVLFILGMAGLFYGIRTLEVPYRFVVYGLAILIFGDVGYVAYFNSFYSEPASIIFLIWTLAFGLAAAIWPPWRQLHLLLIIGFFISAGLFVLAKPQNALLGLPLAVLGVRLLLISTNMQRGLRIGVSAALAGVLVVVSVGYTLVGQPPRFREENLYDMVFAEILPHSSTPARDLRELGLPATYIQWSGSSAYTPGAANSDPAFRQNFFDQISFEDIGLFYARHPIRFLELAQRGAANAFTLRPTYLGNFERSTGYPPTFQSKAFDFWSNLKRRYVPKSLLTIALFFTASATLALFCWRRQYLRYEQTLVYELHITVLVMAVMQYASVLLGDGEYEIAKHFFLFNMLYDLSVCIAVVYLLYGVSSLRRRVKLALTGKI